MQIHLKQNEIEAALKLFVSQQGINLANKTITMDFTAGRKESGISVEMSIEEMYSVESNYELVKRTSPSVPVKETGTDPTEPDPQPAKGESLFASK